jgi:hypothetical protein
MCSGTVGRCSGNRIVKRSRAARQAQSAAAPRRHNRDHPVLCVPAASVIQLGGAARLSLSDQDNGVLAFRQVGHVGVQLKANDQTAKE